jgi:hypothetical protein
VPDEYDRLVDSGNHVAHLGGIAGDAVQRIPLPRPRGPQLFDGIGVDAPTSVTL